MALLWVRACLKAHMVNFADVFLFAVTEVTELYPVGWPADLLACQTCCCTCSCSLPPVWQGLGCSPFCMSCTSSPFGSTFCWSTSGTPGPVLLPNLAPLSGCPPQELEVVKTRADTLTAEDRNWPHLHAPIFAEAQSKLLPPAGA